MCRRAEGLGVIKRQQRIARIAAVAKEYLAARSAAHLLLVQLRADPNYGSGQGWEAGDGAAFNKNLDATYLIRLFAEFEAGLRDYWANHLGRTTHPPISHLMQSVADQRLSVDHFEDAEAVRDYRNFLVHDEAEEAPADMRTFEVPEAKSHLYYFFGRLDPDW
jgi:hypothetical protein